MCIDTHVYTHVYRHTCLYACPHTCLYAGSGLNSDNDCAECWPKLIRLAPLVYAHVSASVDCAWLSSDAA